MATDARALGTTAATYATLFAVVILLFGLLRRAAGFHKFFAPNRYSQLEDSLQRPLIKEGILKFEHCCVRSKPCPHQPRQLPTGALQWIPAVWRMTQAEVIDLAGMDAAMHLRVLSFGTLQLNSAKRIEDTDEQATCAGTCINLKLHVL